MKISVITLQNISNYGSVLQAFATIKFFEELGYETELVDYWRKNMTDENIAHDLVVNKQLKFKNIWGRTSLTRRIAEGLLASKIKWQARPFRLFVRENISVTDIRYTSYEELKHNPPLADYYCVGSDQVWNSEWNGGFDDSFYLGYVPDGKPKLAFSSSIGMNSFSGEDALQVQKYLSEFKLLTVRESSAINILNELGIKATAILDPTLLVDADIWKKLIVSEIKEKNPYILVYQLNENPAFDAAVEQAAKLFKKDVVRVEYRKSRKKGKHIVLPTVNQWLSYFYFADYIITDSFHGTAFSLIFKKQFVNILPNKYSERINNILRITELENRRLNNTDDVSLLTEWIDYQFVHERLELEKEKAKQVITYHLNGYEKTDY